MKLIKHIQILIAYYKLKEKHHISIKMLLQLIKLTLWACTDCQKTDSFINKCDPSMGGNNKRICKGRINPYG